jgi:hypothetical protein
MRMADVAYAYLLEAHQRDREALFEALRRLDAARDVLHAVDEEQQGD